MQRGARFAIFDIPFGAPCWAQRGRQKYGKTNVFLLVSITKSMLGAATKRIPKNTTCEICLENKYFERLLWELLGIHLGWSLFVCARRRCSNGTLKNSKKYLNVMVWEMF
jgi:hypothetical protein